MWQLMAIYTNRPNAKLLIISTVINLSQSTSNLTETLRLIQVKLFHIMALFVDHLKGKIVVVTGAGKGTFKLLTLLFGNRYYESYYLSVNDTQ